MGLTSIEWTDCSWNCVRGCSMAKGSEKGGCLNCYAARMAARNLPEMRSPTTGEPFAVMRESGPRWTGRVELIPEKLDEPLRWRKPRRVFVNSMSDLFHEALDFHDIAAVYGVMAHAPQHTFQILTKRPERALAFMRWMVALAGDDLTSPTSGVKTMATDPVFGAEMAAGNRGVRFGPRAPSRPTWPLRNVWLGVSIEDQATADKRISELIHTPAAVRFISLEPMLEGVDLLRWQPFCHASHPTGSLAGIRGIAAGKIDWVIVGGESGPGARPFDVAWARAVVRQCREAGVPVFVKQMGSYVRTRNDSLSTELDPDVPTDWPEPEGGWGRIDENLDGFRDGYQGAPIRIHLTHPKGGDPAEWPEDLRIREFPR